MRLRTAGAIGTVAAGITALVSATPAVAAPDCGPVPAGATLTLIGGTTCELDFAVAGSYSWTTPAGVTGLQALLVGGGSGAAWNAASAQGYAGNAGWLTYADYSSTSASGGAPAIIVVGDGGATVTSFPDVLSEGENSTVTVGGVPSLAFAGGGQGINTCLPEDATNAVDAGNGRGALGYVSGPSCETSYSPGVTPSTGPVDSNGNPRPAVFSDITTELGRGGRVLLTADTLPADADLDGLGFGADVRYESLDTIPQANLSGGSGRVILRYTIGAALPTMGTDVAPTLTVAALAAGLGAVLLAASRRRKKA